MQYEEILKLVKGVSEAGLTNFEYTEGNIRIVMSCPYRKADSRWRSLLRHRLLRHLRLQQLLQRRHPMISPEIS